MGGEGAGDGADDDDGAGAAVCAETARESVARDSSTPATQSGRCPLTRAVPWLRTQYAVELTDWAVFTGAHRSLTTAV